MMTCLAPLGAKNEKCWKVQKVCTLPSDFQPEDRQITLMNDTFSKVYKFKHYTGTHLKLVHLYKYTQNQTLSLLNMLKVDIQKMNFNLVRDRHRDNWTYRAATLPINMILIFNFFIVF